MPHVIEAEEIILALAAPAHGRAMRAGGLAAFPLAGGSGSLRRFSAIQASPGSKSKYFELSFIASRSMGASRGGHKAAAAIITRAVACLL